MPRLARRFLPALLTGFLLAAAGCAGSDEAAGPVERTTTVESGEPVSAPVCPPAWKAGWRALADRIGAPVYCPSWLPDPLTGEIGGPWEGVNSVTKDGSYLLGFIWFERGAGEVHVNLRGYPRRAEIPTCNGRPCFSDSGGSKHVAGREVEIFTVNRGADTWHVLYLWEDDGSLYTLSQHVVPDLGLSYGRVVENLDRMMGGLVKVAPTQS